MQVLVADADFDIRGTRLLTHRSFCCDNDHEASFLCQPVCISAAVLRAKSHTAQHSLLLPHLCVTALLDIASHATQWYTHRRRTPRQYLQISHRPT